MKTPIISVQNVTKTYNGEKPVYALRGITLDIIQGEIISLLGVNGAGKTTLSSLIATLHPVTSGDILYNGKSIYEDLYNYRHLVGFCPQKVNLDDDLTVEQNLVFAGQYMGLSKEDSEKRAHAFIKEYNLNKYRNSKPDTLSGGYARRVLIARSLMHSPEILILDEPTVGLDPHIRHQLWEIIMQLKNNGTTVILTTHYLDEADFLSDRICVIDKGRVQLIDTPTTLKTTYNKSCLEDVFIQLVQEETETE